MYLIQDVTGIFQLVCQNICWFHLRLCSMWNGRPTRTILSFLFKIDNLILYTMPLFVDGLSVVYHAHNWKNESWLNQSPLSSLQAAFCWYSYDSKCSFHPQFFFFRAACCSSTLSFVQAPKRVQWFTLHIT
jgi:hypothetical protein